MAATLTASVAHQMSLPALFDDSLEDGVRCILIKLDIYPGPELVVQDSNAEELVLRLQYNFSFPFDRLYELRDLIGYVEGLSWIVIATTWQASSARLGSQFEFGGSRREPAYCAVAEPAFSQMLLARR